MTKKIVKEKIWVWTTIALILLFAAGCNSPFKQYVHIHDRYPVYEKDMPSLTIIPLIHSDELNKLDDETKESIIKLVEDLKIEAAQLRAFLDSYNEYAKRKNAEYDQLFKK